MAADHAAGLLVSTCLSSSHTVDARFRAAYSAVVSLVSHDTSSLRTQVHAERVSVDAPRARSDALTAPTLLSGVRRMRPTCEHHTCLCAATRRLS